MRRIHFDKLDEFEVEPLKKPLTEAESREISRFIKILKLKGYLKRKLNKIVNIDSEILHGTSVFKGTRVPIHSLFSHIESGVSIEDFLKDFPSVSKEQAEMLLELSK